MNRKIISLFMVLLFCCSVVFAEGEVQEKKNYRGQQYEVPFYTNGKVVVKWYKDWDYIEYYRQYIYNGYMICDNININAKVKNMMIIFDKIKENMEDVTYKDKDEFFFQFVEWCEEAGMTEFESANPIQKIDYWETKIFKPFTNNPDDPALHQIDRYRADHFYGHEGHTVIMQYKAVLVN